MLKSVNTILCAKSIHSGNEDLWRKEGEGAQTLKCWQSDCSMALALHITTNEGGTMWCLRRSNGKCFQVTTTNKCVPPPAETLGNPPEGALLQTDALLIVPSQAPTEKAGVPITTAMK